MLKKYVAKTREIDHGKTAYFYNDLHPIVNYYITLSRNIRICDFEMFKYAIPKMANLLFIVNQPNYARYCVEYLDKLNNVNQRHTKFEDDFLNRCFRIKKPISHSQEYE